MELWLSATLLATVLSVGITLTDKYIVSRAKIVGYLLLIGLIGLLSLFLLPLTHTPWPTLNQWALGMMLGVIYSILIYSAFRAFQLEEVSRLSALSILPTLAITIFAAVFFDEHLRGVQFLAFGCFIVGAILLATRFELRVRWFEDLTEFKVERMPRHARSLFTKPAIDVGQVTQDMKGVLVSAYEAALNPRITFIAATKRLHLIKGLGWYGLALGLAVPYALLAKHLNDGGEQIVSGFVTIRVGLALGAVLIAIGNKDEVFEFFRHSRILAIASVKELFGVTANFLALFAAAAGPIAIVRSMVSLETVGVLIVGSVLARYGIIAESTKRTDLIQKGFGVLFVVTATVLLFLG